MAFSYAGSIYGNFSFILNSTISNTIIKTGSISQSSIDMLSSNGNYQNITNVATPINPHDVVIKEYIDALGISINDIPLISTFGSLISSELTGSFIITISPNVINGPSGIFNITKNNANYHGSVLRPVSMPGISTEITLQMSWPPNSYPVLFKNGINFDGSYKVKIM